MIYSSIDNDKIKYLKKLKTKKYRDIEEKFLIESEHLIEEAFKEGILEEVYILEGKTINIDIKVNYVTLKVLKYISDLETPNVIGVCRKIKENEIGKRVIALDNIQDPGNLGTIIRSAVAFNIDTIILSDNSVDLYNDKVIRASEGMIFKVNIVRKKLLDTITELKKTHHVYGTKVDGGKELKTIEKNEDFVIIMGNEGRGMSSELDSLCDEFIYINISSKCESLNVGVATSIILYELDK